MMMSLFSLSLARDAIVGTVKLHFFDGFKSLLCAFVCKSYTVSIIQNDICCMFAAVVTSGRGREFLTLVGGIRALFPCFLIASTSHEVHVSRI